MRVETDDEVYRVDAVWLGPPRATLPWRARYVAYGLGLPLFLAVFAVARAFGFDVGVFLIAWCVVITVALTRFLGRFFTAESPVSAMATLALAELSTPRPGRRRRVVGHATTTRGVIVHPDPPRPSTPQAHDEQRGGAGDAASPSPSTS